MIRSLFSTNRDTGALIGRVALGALLVPHGLQHALGLLGGYGFSGTLGWMTNTLGFPAPLAVLAIVTAPEWGPYVSPYARLLHLWLQRFLHRMGVRVLQSGPRCRRCNYDLRGNVSRICPECGEPVAEGAK